MHECRAGRARQLQLSIKSKQQSVTGTKNCKHYILSQALRTSRHVLQLNHANNQSIVNGYASFVMTRCASLVGSVGSARGLYILLISCCIVLYIALCTYIFSDLAHSKEQGSSSMQEALYFVGNADYRWPWTCSWGPTSHALLYTLHDEVLLQNPYCHGSRMTWNEPQSAAANWV